MKLKTENQIWDPETAYRESRAGNLRLLIAILVIIVVGAAWISGILAHQKRTGEVALNASMTFEEADRLLRDSGFNPMGLSYRNGKKVLQTYDSRAVFSCLPAYSMLENNEENNQRILRLDHVFEEDGKHSMADPGEVFRKLKEAGLTVIVHVIFGLPGETKEDMLATVKYLAGLFEKYKCGKAGTAGPQCFDGVKLQMLQILKGTEMAEEYLREPFPLFSLEEYTELVKESVRLLPADLVLHRMTGDGPKRLLIAPLWCADKKRTLNYMNRVLGDVLE